MMFLNKFRNHMVQQRSGYFGITAVFLVLFVTACTSAPTNTGGLENRFPIGEAEEIFSAGFSNIFDKYIDGVSVETLAMEGVRGLSALDPGISIIKIADTLEVRHRRRVVSRIPMPAPDDSDGWAFVVASMIADTQTFSKDLAGAEPEMLYEAVFDGAMGALDVFSRYAGQVEAKDNRAKRDGFGGIGVRFRLNGKQVLITEVLPTTPAAEAGRVPRTGTPQTCSQARLAKALPTHGPAAEALVSSLKGSSLLPPLR